MIPSESDTAEVDRLRAERDALRAEVEDLRGRPRHHGWWRQSVTATIVVLACVLLTASVVGLWADRNFLDTDRFVARAGPLVEQPAVQQALALRITDELMVLIDPASLFEEALPERGQILAGPLANAVESFVGDQVEAFLGTEQFEELWDDALTVAHGTAVRVLDGDSDVLAAADGQVTLNLVPVINSVLAQITAQTPEILGREVDLPDVTVESMPDGAITSLENALGVPLDDDFGQFTVYDDGTLTAAQDAIALFDRLVLVLPILGVLLAGLALWLSHRRRRTVLQLCAGLAIGMVLVRRIGFRLEDEVAALPPRPQGQEAAGLVAHAFLDPLITFGAWVLVGAAVIVLVAVLSADYPWAVSLRRRSGALWARAVATTTAQAHEESTVAWIGTHRDALLVAGGVVALAILWFADLSWAGLLVVLAVAGAYAVAVHRIGTPRDAPPTGPASPNAAPEPVGGR